MRQLDIELDLIYRDIVDISELMLSLERHQSLGYLSLILSPVTSFIAEESHKYFLSRKVDNLSSTLFKDYGIAIKKSRALLKLFNDVDGGKDGLRKTFSIFQEKSLLWMNVGKSGLKGYISRLLQPDIGVYFFEEHPVYMTIAGFSAMGKTKKEVESLIESDFEDISQQSYSFGWALGEYFGLVLTLMAHRENLGAYKSSVFLLPDIKITHNDYYSNKIYKRVTTQTGLKEKSMAPALFFILTQVNVACELLPRLLSLDSNLLVRMQFLTAYHVVNSLLEINNVIGDHDLTTLISNDNILVTIPNIKQVRNMLAHYGLGEGWKYVSNKDRALDEAIRGLSGISKIELYEKSVGQLHSISDWTRNRLSKSTLKDIRALLGDHT